MGSIEQGCGLSGVELQDYLGGLGGSLVLSCSGPHSCPIAPLGLVVRFVGNAAVLLRFWSGVWLEICHYQG